MKKHTWKTAAQESEEAQLMSDLVIRWKQNGVVFVYIRTADCYEQFHASYSCS